MKVISKSEAEKLLKEGKAKLHWHRAQYSLHITVPIREFWKLKLDRSYRVQYETGKKLEVTYPIK